jgi:hypothetical protein
MLGTIAMGIWIVGVLAVLFVAGAGWGHDDEE